MAPAIFPEKQLLLTAVIEMMKLWLAGAPKKRNAVFHYKRYRIRVPA
jgi:hypothetical protein